MVRLSIHCCHSMPIVLCQLSGMCTSFNTLVSLLYVCHYTGMFNCISIYNTPVCLLIQWCFTQYTGTSVNTLVSLLIHWYMYVCHYTGMYINIDYMYSSVFVNTLVLLSIHWTRYVCSFTCMSVNTLVSVHSLVCLSIQSYVFLFSCISILIHK